MASFSDSLVERKGSLTASQRSGSTNASTSNVAETRDFSRQSERNARIHHRKAIQVRKVAFLVLILLLLMGGLSYAIYKVVSNDSDGDETRKAMLENGGISFSKTSLRSKALHDSKETLHVNSGGVRLTDHTSTKLAKSVLPSTETVNLELSSHSWNDKSSNTPDNTAVKFTNHLTAIFLANTHLTIQSTSLLSTFATPNSPRELEKTSRVASETLVTSLKDVHVSTTQKLFPTSAAPSKHVKSSKAEKVTPLTSAKDKNPAVTHQSSTNTSFSHVATTQELFFISATLSKLVKTSMTVLDTQVISVGGVEVTMTPNLFSRSAVPSQHAKTSVVQKETPLTSVKDENPTVTHQSSVNSIDVTTTQNVFSRSAAPSKHAKTSTVGPETPLTSVKGENASTTEQKSTVRSSFVVQNKSSKQLRTPVESSIDYESPSDKYISLSTITSSQSILSSGKSVSVTLDHLATSHTMYEDMLATTVSISKDLTSSILFSQLVSFEHAVSTGDAKAQRTSLSAMKTGATKTASLSSSLNQTTVNASKTVKVGSNQNSRNVFLTSISENVRLKSSMSPIEYISSSNMITSHPSTQMAVNLISTTVIHASVIVNHTTTGSTGQGNQSSHGDATSALPSQLTSEIIPSKVSSKFAPSSSIWIEPYYHEWGNWSICSLKCGGGYMNRTRSCPKDGECDDLGPNINVSTCNMHKCNETIFEVSLNVTNYDWTDDYYNTSSKAYKELENSLMTELLNLYGSNVSAKLNNISRGSVIVLFTITLPTTKNIQTLTASTDDGKLGNLSISKIKIVNHMVPGVPSSLVAQNTTHNSTFVHWASLYANVTNGILLGYKVIINPGNITLNMNPGEMSIEITHLIPETYYTVQLLGYNINGDGMKKSVSFKTNERPPHYFPWGGWSNCSRSCGGGITSRTRNCSKEGLCTHLGELEQRKHCNVNKCNTTTYGVSMNMTNVEWTDDLHNTSSKAYKELLAKFIAELQKMYPNATISLGSITKGSVNFTFVITFPSNDPVKTDVLKEDLQEKGLGNYTVEVKNIEDKNLPRSPPSAINVTMITHHSVVVSWLPIPEEDSNGAIIGYKIVLIPGSNKTREFNLIVEASDTKFSYHINALVPNMTYHFHMYGYNINGKGIESNTINFRTKVQIPKINLVNISQITPNHAVLHWTRVADNYATYGIISGYKIVLFKHDQRFDIPASAGEERKDLANLVPNTTYNVTVSGFNEYGDGVVSDGRTFTTLALIPKPASVIVVNITSDMAVVQWETISSEDARHGGIRGYKIIVNRGSTSFNITATANTSYVVLGNLWSNTTYSVQTLAYNEYGDGLTSDKHYFTTMGNDEKQANNPGTSPPSQIKTIVFPHSPTTSVKRHHFQTTFSKEVTPSPRLQSTNLTIGLHTTESSVSPHFIASKLWSTTYLKETHSKLISTVGLMSNRSLQSSMSHFNDNLSYSPSMLSSQSSKIQSIHSHLFMSPSNLITVTTNVSTSHYNLSLSPSLQSQTFTEIPVTATKSLSTTLTTGTEYIVGKIHFTDEKFSSELNDPDSTKFKELANEIETWLHALFANNSLEFVKVEVLGFSRGSVVVEFFLTVAKTLKYKPQNITETLRKAKVTGGLGSKSFEIFGEDFFQQEEKPTVKPTSPNEANKGLQKNDDEDDGALIVAIVMCVVLVVGVSVVVAYIGKKRNWLTRSRRKVVPDDDEEEDLYQKPTNSRMRLKTARGPRKAHGARINSGQNTTEC